MSKPLLSAGIVVLAGVVAAAAPQLKSSWRNMDPAATPVSNVIVIGFTKDQAARRLAEDSIAIEIRKNGGRATPSYTLIPDQLPKDASAIKEKVAGGGFDGAVVTRVAGVTTEQSWDYLGAMPVYYASPWTYWGYWYPYAWDPFYLQSDTTVRVETLVYGVKNEVIIWSGLSESINPGSVRTVIRQVAVPVGIELKKRNVIRAAD
jgi:hypothetical protein